MAPAANSSFRQFFIAWHANQVGAIGVKCRKWITQHGLAVNVGRASLGAFQGIVPCGIEGRPVGCLNQFLPGGAGGGGGGEEEEEKVTVLNFAKSMQAALERVFAIQLVEEESTRRN